MQSRDTQCTVHISVFCGPLRPCSMIHAHDCRGHKKKMQKTARVTCQLTANGTNESISEGARNTQKQDHAAQFTNAYCMT